LERTGSGFRLHKIFADSIDIDENSVIAVLENDMEIRMNEGNKKFTADLPELVNSKDYEFHFIFNDSQGIKYREPSDRNYSMNYGDLIVGLSSKEDFISEIPSDYKLFQNYPNPFNPETTIRYFLPESHANSKVSLKLFNVLGEEVREIVDDFQDSGSYTVILSSVGLSSGVYFYQLQTDKSSITKKLIILK
jgi:hypothetical protein